MRNRRPSQKASDRKSRLERHHPGAKTLLTQSPGRASRPHFPWGSWAPKDHLSNNAIMPSVTDNPVEYTSLRRGFSSTARFANSRSTCVSPFRMMSAKRASTASDPVRMAMGVSRFWQRAFRPPPYHVRTCKRRALYFRNYWFH